MFNDLFKLPFLAFQKLFFLQISSLVSSLHTHKFGCFRVGFFSFLTLIAIQVSAQQTKVLVQNSPDRPSTVLLKWYSPEIIYEEGVNIYRRPVYRSQWTRLNDQPIVRKKQIDPAHYETDPELEFYVDLVNDVDGVDIPEPLIVLNMVIKTFESSVYADFLGIYFEDPTAEAGQSYLYKVQKISGGRETLLGRSDTLTVGAYQQDVPVKDFTVIQEEDIMHLDWTVEEDRFYAVNLYQTSTDTAGEIKLNNKPVIISEIEDSTGGFSYPSPKYKLNNLKEEVTYTFTLEGLGFFGETLQKTAPIEVTFGDVTPPAPPRDLTSEQDTMLVRLTWEQPEGLNDVREIRVFRTSQSEAPYEVVHTTSRDDTVFTDQIEVPGPYYYYVSSFDFSGNEARSQTVFVDVPDQDPPAPPKGLTIRVDTGRFYLAWEANREPDLKGYLLFRSTDGIGGENVALLTGDPLTVPEYTQRLPKNIKNNFYYYLIAVDSSDNRSGPSKVVTGHMPDITPPEKPVLKSLSYTEDAIVISWTANADEDLAGYHVYRSDSIRPMLFEQANQKLLSGRSTRYTDRRAEGNKRYIYYVLAVDSAGNLSAASDHLYAALKKEEPLEGEIKLYVKHRKRKKQNELTWTTPQGDWLGYTVYRGESQKALKPQTGLQKDGGLMFTDRHMEGEKYYYQVQVFNQKGKILKSEIKLWER